MSGRYPDGARATRVRNALRRAWMTAHPGTHYSLYDAFDAEPFPGDAVVIEWARSLPDATLMRVRNVGEATLRDIREVAPYAPPDPEASGPTSECPPVERLVALLSADATDPTRAAMWRYGVRHALTLVRGHLATQPAAPDPEAVETLAKDLFAANLGSCVIVAEWMLKRGWTEPLDDAPPATP